MTMLMAISSTACGNPEQKFEVKVRDEDGKPLEGIVCKAGFNLPKKEGTGISPYIVSGVTAANGSVEISGETVFFDTSVRVSGEGYYDSVVEKLWITGKNGKRWEPWPVRVDLTIKKKKTPQPMYVAKFDAQKWLALPDGGLGPFGFDLEIGDWVKPLGKGLNADFILEGNRNEPSANLQNPKGSVTLTFTNELDGIISYDDSGGSTHVGPTDAPKNGYVNRWEFKNWKSDGAVLGGISRDFRNEAYVFRVRTRVDSNGKIVEARYGKIDGRIRGWLIDKAPGIMFTYYFTDTPNERGLEWDMKNNLIANDKIKAPRRP